MGGLEALAFAVVEVEDEVVFEDVVVVRVAEFAGGAVNGVGRALEFGEGADRSFVEVDDKIFGPFVAGGKLEGGAIFLVAEPALEAQAFEDLLERCGVGENHFDLFTDFVAAALVVGEFTDGELLGRGFEGEDNAGTGSLPSPGLRRRRPANKAGVHSAKTAEWGRGGVPSGGGFGADAEKLTVLGEAAIGSVEDEVLFVDAGGGGLGAEFGEGAKEGFGVGDTKFDFGFARHLWIV